MSTKRTRGDAGAVAGKKRAQTRAPTMLKELSAAITSDSNPPSLRTLLAPILRACEAFDAAGNADGTALCVCEAYFVTRSISLQLARTLSSAISGAPPSKMESKAPSLAAASSDVFNCSDGTEVVPWDARALQIEAALARLQACFDTLFASQHYLLALAATVWELTPLERILFAFLFSIQASSNTVFRTHFPYRDSDEDYLVLISGCAPIDIGAFVDDDRAAVKDGQLLVDESSDASRRIRCGLDCARVLVGRRLTSDQMLGLASTEMLRGVCGVVVVVVVVMTTTTTTTTMLMTIVPTCARASCSVCSHVLVQG